MSHVSNFKTIRRSGDELMPPAPTEPMTVEAYLAYCEIARPDGQKWELIEGRIVVQDSPTDWHQVIAGNIVAILRAECMRLGASWTPLPGIGVQVPSAPNSLPEPDVMVKEHPLTGARNTIDGLVLFEIHSDSNRPKDKRWKREHYPSVPNCQHFVTLEQDQALVIRYDRAGGWQGVALDRLDDALELPALGVSLPLRAIYWRTPVAGG